MGDPKLVYRHTDKAIRNGGPADRVFIGVSKTEGIILAWKCTEQRDGTLRCPWDLTRSFTLAEAVAQAPTRGDNGSQPTAEFTHDSFYKKVEV